jgi:hypothetical protein
MKNSVYSIPHNWWFVDGHLGMWTVLYWTRYSKTQFGVSITSVDWRGTLRTLHVTFCIVITRCTETFWSLCIILSYLSLYSHTQFWLFFIYNCTVQWREDRRNVKFQVVTVGTINIAVYVRQCTVVQAYRNFWRAYFIAHLVVEMAVSSETCQLPDHTRSHFEIQYPS